MNRNFFTFSNHFYHADTRLIMKQITDTPYEIGGDQFAASQILAARVNAMRTAGRLTPEVLGTIRKYFKIKNIYHSNAIEGNALDVGETRLVVEQGLTLTGKPLKDQAEAKNLSDALDFLEDLASQPDRPITEADVRQIHLLVLKGVNDENAGRYRGQDVEISGSAFKPTPFAAVPSEMERFSAWLQRASVPGFLFSSDMAILAACAAHTWFVMIHPFIDGNGRVARLMMNLMLMRYGFPIAVITRDDRLRYYEALETAQTSDLTPFVALVSESLDESLEEYEYAAREQRDRIEWAKSIASKFDKRETVRETNNYEVWRSAMEFLKSQFRQTSEVLDNSASVSRIYFVDFGNLEFEKYLSIKHYGSAKKTWFFRLDFRSGQRAARYLFMFGASRIDAHRKSAEVTLHVSRESPPNSFRYEYLDALGEPNVPGVYEIGYKAEEEAFIVRGPNGSRVEKIDSLCRRFVQDVIEKHFS